MKSHPGTSQLGSHVNATLLLVLHPATEHVLVISSSVQQTRDVYRVIYLSCKRESKKWMSTKYAKSNWNKQYPQALPQWGTVGVIRDYNIDIIIAMTEVIPNWKGFLEVLAVVFQSRITGHQWAALDSCILAVIWFQSNISAPAVYAEGHRVISPLLQLNIGRRRGDVI